MNIADLAHDYLDLQTTIKTLEAQCLVIKDQMKEALPPEQKEWHGDGRHVTWVKGRRAEKVDAKKVKQGFVLGGVDLALIDAVFTQATTVSEGQPHLRISEGEEMGE